MAAPWCDSDECDSDDGYDSDHPDWNLLRGCDLHLFAGPAGHERLVRVHPTYDPWLEETVVYYYKGPKGRERLAWETVDRGRHGTRIKYYEGTKGQEHLVRDQTYSGANHRYGNRNVVKFYKGPKGKERLVSKHDWDNGTTKHYQGPQGREHKVREETSEGRVYHYVKEWPGYYQSAVLERTVHPDGSVDVYDGEDCDGHADRVSHIHPSGQVDHFGRPSNYCDTKFTVRTEWPDGTITHFQYRYKDHEEVPLVTEHPNGQVTYHGALLPEKKGSGPQTLIPDGKKRNTYKWQMRIELRNGRVLNGAFFHWLRVRRWVTKRVIALHWQERTQMRLAAPDGAGRRADRAAYEADFGA